MSLEAHSGRRSSARELVKKVAPYAAAATGGTSYFLAANGRYIEAGMGVVVTAGVAGGKMAISRAESRARMEETEAYLRSRNDEYFQLAMLANNTLSFNQALREDEQRRAQHLDEWGVKGREVALEIVAAIENAKGRKFLPDQINCGTIKATGFNQERHDLYLATGSQSLQAVPMQLEKGVVRLPRFVPQFHKATPAPMGSWLDLSDTLSSLVESFAQGKKVRQQVK